MLAITCIFNFVHVEVRTVFYNNWGEKNAAKEQLLCITPLLVKRQPDELKRTVHKAKHLSWIIHHMFIINMNSK